jgi:hypothetical protein
MLKLSYIVRKFGTPAVTAQKTAQKAPVLTAFPVRKPADVPAASPAKTYIYNIRYRSNERTRMSRAVDV